MSSTGEQIEPKSGSKSDSSTPDGEKPAPIPMSALPRVLFSRRWWWTTLLVIAGMIVMARLGIWQLDRLQQRRARNVEFLAQISVPPMLLTGDERPADPAALRDRPAEARGLYDFSQQLVLVQQSWQGRPGGHLITPMLLGDGDVAVLVDRGWVPTADVEAGNLVQYDQPGQQVVEGAIQLSHLIDIEAIQKQITYELLPFYLLASPAEGPPEDLPYRLKSEIDLTDGPHLGYAIQWFIFTTILGLGYGRFVSTHTERGAT
jgi:surfeit locus 1 family protein